MLLDLLPTLLRRPAWSLAALVGLAGCSDAPPRPDAEALRAVIADHCEQVSRCGCGGALQADTCNEDLEARWNERVRGAEDRGLTYDAECFARLGETIQRYGCRDPGSNPSLCAGFCAVYHGSRQSGESCSGIDELASNCAQGLVCSDGTCTEPCAALGGRKAGEVCATPDFGYFDDCAPGLGCNFGSGICAPLAAVGESCDTRNCLEGLECDWNTLTCVASPNPHCGTIQCEAEQFCQNTPAGPTCLDLAQLDESCNEVSCADGLLCNMAAICQLPPEAGEPCVRSQCAAGNVCDFTSDTCLALPVEGEACIMGRCAAGSQCVTGPEDPEGTCNALTVDGEMCMGHGECASGYCPNGFCWPVPRLGDDCTGTGYCAPGLVCNGATCEPTLTRGPAVCMYPGW